MKGKKKKGGGKKGGKKSKMSTQFLDYKFEVRSEEVSRISWRKKWIGTDGSKWR